MRYAQTRQIGTEPNPQHPLMTPSPQSYLTRPLRDYLNPKCGKVVQTKAD